MTVREIGHGSHRYMWDTSDTKPTATTHGCAVGDTGYDRQTGIMYITYDGTNWVEKDTVARLEAGTAVIGKVKNNPVYDPHTGAVAIASATAPGAVFRLLAVRLHLSAAPTQETFTIKQDAGDGTAYDTVLYSRDMSVGTPEDLVIPFGEGYEFEADDEIDCAWTNTDTKTYGLVIVYELL